MISELNTGETFHNVNPLILDPMIPETATFQVTALDSLTGAELVEWLTVLVADNPHFHDLNGDGCNTMEDLHTVLPVWNQDTDDDANGDGVLNLLDLLYVSVSGTCH